LELGCSFGWWDLAERGGGRRWVGGGGGMGWVRHLSAGRDIPVALPSTEGGNDGAKTDGWHNQGRAVAKRSALDALVLSDYRI